MFLVSTTRIIPGRAVPSFLFGRYSAVKVRNKLYVTDARRSDFGALASVKLNRRRGAGAFLERTVAGGPPSPETA